MSRRKIEPNPPRNGADTAHHPAVEYFSEHVKELLADHRVVDEESGQWKRLNPHSFSELLQEQTEGKDVPGLSQNQIYRYLDGEAIPHLDAVYEIAKVFGVSPSSLASSRVESRPRYINAVLEPRNPPPDR